jgi:hypothetical protein
VSDEVAGSTLDPSTPGPSPGILLPDSGMDEQPVTAPKELVRIKTVTETVKTA